MLKDLLLWFYWYPFKLFLRHLPASCVYKMAGILGAALTLLAAGKRRQLETEYRTVFGAISRAGNAREVVKKTFIHWMRSEFEVLLFPAMNRGNIDAYVRYQGIEHLDSALSGGKGALLLFAHFGANQMVMPAVGYKGYTMNQLSAPPTVWVEKIPNKKFSPMDKKALDIRWQHELSLPVNHINIFGSLKRAFVSLKNNEVLGVAIDGGGGKKRVEVDFLGGKASFSTGSIELAMRADCPVLPVFMLRSEAGYNTMVIEPPLALVPGDDADNLRKNMGFFIARFEPYVVKYPCHYLTFLALRRFMAEQGDAPFLIAGERKP